MPNSYGSWRTGLQIDNIYPVGCIYMSVSSTNPGFLFGGTWEQIEDTFLLCAGSTYLAGSTGGSATHTHSYNHTHTTDATTTGATTLTLSQVPSHSHTVNSHNHAQNDWVIGMDNGKKNQAAPNGSTLFQTVASGANGRAGGIYDLKNKGWNNTDNYVTGSSAPGTNAQGGGGSHTHSQIATTSNGPNTTNTDNASSLPPYLVVYVFKRTA